MLTIVRIVRVFLENSTELLTLSLHIFLNVDYS